MARGVRSSMEEYSCSSAQFLVALQSSAIRCSAPLPSVGDPEAKVKMWRMSSGGNVGV